MIKIFPEDVYWNGKLLVFTWHFKAEMERLKKPLGYVLKILENGEHKLIGDKQKKYNVFCHYKDEYLCLSYVEHENIILIHIKPISRKK